LSSLEVEELHKCLKYYTSKALQVGNTRDEEVGVEAYKYLHIEKEHCAFLAPEKKITKNFSQSEAFMAPGSHVG
jgi:hypothetical protein